MANFDHFVDRINELDNDLLRAQKRIAELEAEKLELLDRLVRLEAQNAELRTANNKDCEYFEGRKIRITKL